MVSPLQRYIAAAFSQSFWLDRGGGNRGRYGNFGDDNNREDGFSGGRQNYGQRDNNYGNREDRYNNYGNRGSHSRGGAGGGGGGSGYEQERRTSESMSQLSLEGKVCSDPDDMNSTTKYANIRLRCIQKLFEFWIIANQDTMKSDVLQISSLL